ncbi:hypothetical protein CK203_047761 [Vitis vinifera]|uniref:Uncharacterized protein n=1 Tax=Vitis vinifera TaxID=29760 RepID=A0A438GY73_VITVI|nr:hypothetical protein CK203_047761 [Vitis vinifera]
MFVEVRREENRTSVMMGGYSSIIHENSTIVATDATASVATNLLPIMLPVLVVKGSQRK